MHLERYTRAIAKARWVAQAHKPLNMGMWFANEDDPEDCNTAACVAGWMARDPWMQQQGLSIDHENLQPAYGTLRSHEAMAAFLCISLLEEERIFSPWFYPIRCSADITATMVADRMQDMLDKHLSLMNLRDVKELELV